MPRRTLLALLVLVAIAVGIAAPLLSWRLRAGSKGGLKVEARLIGHKLSVGISVEKGEHRVSEICVDSSCYHEGILVTGRAEVTLYLDRIVEQGSTHNVTILFSDHRPVSLVVREEPPPSIDVRVLNVFYMPRIGLRIIMVNNSTETLSIVAAWINGNLIHPSALTILRPTGSPVNIYLPYTGSINTGNNTCILFLNNGAWIKASFKA